MNATDPAFLQQADELQTLRSLLLADEIAALDQLTRQVEKLNVMVGNNEALRASVSQVFADALADTNRRDPSALAAVVSPVVVQSMKSSTDDIIEVMYPLTGRMVASSVKSAVKTLSDKINTQIESRLSPKVILESITARFSGRSASDRIIAGNGRATVVRALAFDKASGQVNAAWSALDGANDRISGYDNPELVSALIASLSNLAEETFESSTGGLRSLELDGKDLAIRRSGKQIVVLETTGNLTTRQDQQLDAAFVDFVDGLNRASATNDEGGVDAILAELVSCVSGGENLASKKPIASEKPTKRRRGVALTVVILCCLLALPAWTMIRNALLDRDVARIEHVLRQHPQLMHFPITVAPRYKHGSIAVTGLVPSGTSATAFYGELTRTSGRQLILKLLPVVIGERGQ